MHVSTVKHAAAMDSQDGATAYTISPFYVHVQPRTLCAVSFFRALCPHSAPSLFLFAGTKFTHGGPGTGRIAQRDVLHRAYIQFRVHTAWKSCHFFRNLLARNQDACRLTLDSPRRPIALNDGWKGLVQMRKLKKVTVCTIVNLTTRSPLMCLA
ncbi:hypothetical protein CY34DRAFT_415099 [Suillus luteus UH-Slu-Lm8-n1]|uniref:Uncharacterized protein n=1 Tax=Suillus luteus UH-Slu-Lm8-n1 TaxID=930992 RepID=A0A0D0B289_9AGAM|nr:hypothetical protein CY34DRAFT_415099 [Suillus luteus UH-Slu-Lm8-n1]